MALSPRLRVVYSTENGAGENLVYAMIRRLLGAAMRDGVQRYFQCLPCAAYLILAFLSAVSCSLAS